MVFTLIYDTVIVVTISSSIRFTIKGIEDGDCIQAYPHKWSLDHLPPFIPPAPYVICNYILQTILLWSSCNSKLVHLIGDNHFICEVKVSNKSASLGSKYWVVKLIIQCDGKTSFHILRAHGGHLAHIWSTDSFHTG